MSSEIVFGALVFEQCSLVPMIVRLGILPRPWKVDLLQYRHIRMLSAPLCVLI